VEIEIDRRAVDALSLLGAGIEQRQPRTAEMFYDALMQAVAYASYNKPSSITRSTTTIGFS
jgi:hypothetical protein